MNQTIVYTSKDIKRLLGIEKNQLSYLVLTGIIEPNERVRGRGKVHKFSLENLFQLLLVKRLLEFGIELNFIKTILNCPPKESWKSGINNDPNLSKEYKEFAKNPNVLNFYKLDREYYKKNGLVLIILKSNNKFNYIYFSGQAASNYIKKMIDPKETRITNNDALIIDIIKIIEELENKTGEKI
ncbi:MAG: MerR family transcriptional regulator [Promethearchaeota archaeon]